MRLPDAIFLNGSSSAGKTSITRELQAQLPAPYMRFGCDDAFEGSPLSLHNHPDGYEFRPQANGELLLHIGAEGRKVFRAWRAMLRAGLDQGLRMVIDEVLLEPADLTAWIEALAGRDVFFVGVRCGLEELQRRELARGDRGHGQALWQHERVHAHGLYDLEVDTTATTPAACAAAIVAGLEGRARPTAFETLAHRRALAL